MKHILDAVYHNPGEPKFTSAFLDPAHLRGQGYTGQVLVVPVQAAATFDAIDPTLLPAHSVEREWAEHFAVETVQTIDAVKRAGLSCFAAVDFVVLPKRVVERYGQAICTDVAKAYVWDIKGDITPDLHAPALQELLRAQVIEIFERFPGLDGIVVRVGETYLHTLPHHTGGDPITRGVESHVEMIRLLREAVCVESGKTLVYRTWLSGIDEDRAAYLEVSDRVEPHPDLVLSVKHCVGDFHRTHAFSPMLGCGRHAQVVEVQCQREYEGKGAYPNYIAGGVIDGFEELETDRERSLRDVADRPQIAGVWTWSRGGGWMGPYIKNEFWCALNARVMARWAHEPDRPTEDLLNEVLSDFGFDASNLAPMRRLLDLSAAAVLRGLASVRGRVDTLWTRDEFIGGVEDSASYMARSVQQVLDAGAEEELIDERCASVRMWREIESLSRMVEHPDPALLSFLRVSCTYGRICFEVFCAGWTLLLLGRKGDLCGAYERDRMSRALTDYDAAWREWRGLAQEEPSCSTLYREAYCRYVRDRGMEPASGMGDSVNRYRDVSSTKTTEKAPDVVNVLQGRRKNSPRTKNSKNPPKPNVLLRWKPSKGQSHNKQSVIEEKHYLADNSALGDLFDEFVVISECKLKNPTFVWTHGGNKRRVCPTETLQGLNVAPREEPPHVFNAELELDVSDNEDPPSSKTTGAPAVAPPDSRPKQQVGSGRNRQVRPQSERSAKKGASQSASHNSNEPAASSKGRAKRAAAKCSDDDSSYVEESGDELHSDVNDKKPEGRAEAASTRSNNARKKARAREVAADFDDSLGAPKKKKKKKQSSLASDNEAMPAFNFIHKTNPKKTSQKFRWNLERKSNEVQRPHGSCPTRARQQVDNLVRGRIMAIENNLVTAQQMSLALARTDSCDEDETDPKCVRLRAEERTRPWVIVGLCVITDQKPNENGNNKGGEVFLDKPRMHLVTGSKQAQYQAEEFMKGPLDVCTYNDFPTFESMWSGGKMKKPSKKAAAKRSAKRSAKRGQSEECDAGDESDEASVEKAAKKEKKRKSPKSDDEEESDEENSREKKVKFAAI